MILFPKFICKSIITFVTLLLFGITLFAQDEAIVASTTYREVVPVSINSTLDAHGIRTWINEGYNGFGTKVGVIDYQFGGLETFETANGLNVNTPNNETYSDDLPSNNHGTRALEVIHTVAPEASLYACRYRSLEDFTNCINIMVGFDVDIINHSGGVATLPLDGNGIWAQQIQIATNQDILWINAAGNFNEGFISKTFFPDESGCLLFDGLMGQSPLLEIPRVTDNLRGRIMLSWTGTDYGLDNVADLNANEINLQILYYKPGRNDNDPEVSDQLQTGQVDQQPLDTLEVDLSQDFRISICDVTSAELSLPEFVTPAVSSRIVLYLEFVDIPDGSDQSNLTGIADSPFALTVGALQTNAIAPYSSRGPVSIAGALKPDLVAPGELNLPSGAEFVGTSAASAYVAGVASLVTQGYPDWGRNELTTYFTQIGQGIIHHPEQNLTDNVIYGNGQLRLNPPPVLPVNIIEDTTVEIFLPYAQNFETSNPLVGWQQAAGWQIIPTSNNNILVGRGNLDHYVIVEGQRQAEWENPTVGNLLISFDFYLEQNMPGLRIVTRSTPNGYHAIEFLDGSIRAKRDDLGASADFVMEREREALLDFGAVDAPISSEVFHHGDIWLDNEYIYVFLDNKLYLRAIDPESPRLNAGQIILQAFDAVREVQIDNIVIQSVEDASGHFQTVRLSGDWQSNGNTETITENGDTYVRLMQGGSIQANVTVSSDMRFRCDIRREQGDLDIVLSVVEYQEGNDPINAGTLTLQYTAGVAHYIRENNNEVWKSEPINHLYTNTWDYIDISVSKFTNFDGEERTLISLLRDGEKFVDPVELEGESLHIDSIRFRASDNAVYYIDDCLFHEIISTE